MHGTERTKDFDRALLRSRRFRILALFFLGMFLVPSQGQAYIGPGAGFVFLSSFFVFFLTMILALLNLVTWPFRVLFKALKQRKAMAKSMVNRVVVVGLDGLDPGFCDKLISQGKLPHLSAMAENGSYHRLETTCPSISPVAWSTFATGVNPGKHNIFDFLSPNRKLYVAELSSTRIHSTGKKASVSLERKSQSFWSLLGKHGIFSTILRVPITFPPEKFKGLLLSAMCVPDLRGTQGSFTCYSSAKDAPTRHTGGLRIPVTMENDTFRSHIPGPPSPSGQGEIKIEFSAQLDRKAKALRIRLPDQAFTIQEGRYSDWIRLTFKLSRMSKVTGMVLFRLMRTEPDLLLYVTPIHMDPEHPAMPIAHPLIFSAYLAKLLGPFSTLGLAEDTWALNEGVLDDKAFLEQCQIFHAEREKVFFSSLDRVRRGVCATVFDLTDRAQHMFMRYVDPDHPARPQGETGVPKDVLERIYVQMDEMVGRVRKRCRKGDVLMVMSDHGFCSFRRGFNVNSWLLQNGYMTLKDGRTSSGEWFEGVDWSRTQAYGLGLSGLFLNLKGREAQGCVAPEDADRLIAEIAGKLNGLKDEEKGCVAMAKAYPGKEMFFGPYAANGPEIVLGFNPGYRVSWEAAVGIAGSPIFSDNTKAWSGDHCVDPVQIPGVFFCDWKIDEDKARMCDVAPTVLTLLGVDPPGFMDGHSLIRGRKGAAG